MRRAEGEAAREKTDFAAKKYKPEKGSYHSCPRFRGILGEQSKQRISLIFRNNDRSKGQKRISDIVVDDLFNLRAGFFIEMAEEKLDRLAVQFARKEQIVMEDGDDTFDVSIIERDCVVRPDCGS